MVLECFAGLGAMALGLEWAGWEHAAFIERDPFCQAVLRHHWPEVPIHADIKSFSAFPFRGAVDLVSGGPPCQPASLAGKRRGAADDRWLWPDFLRVVGEIAPRWVLAENPPGIASVVPGLAWIREELEGQGYEVEVLMVGADDVGAPHRRKRVWILARLAHGDGAGRAGERLGGLLDGERAALRHDADGRGSRAVGDPSGDPVRQQPGRGGGPYGPQEAISGGAGAALGDAGRQGLALGTRERGDARAEQSPAVRAGDPTRERGWPISFGEHLAGASQHDWEAPRLVHAATAGRHGSEGDAHQGRAEPAGRSEEQASGRRLPLGDVGEPAYGPAGRVADAARERRDARARGRDARDRTKAAALLNRAGLRAAGNSCVPQIVEMIGRAMTRIDASNTTNEVA